MSNVWMAKFRSVPESVNSVANTNNEPPQEITAAHLRGIIYARSIRQRYFKMELFADPAWEILLELYSCGLEQRRHTVGSLCAVVNVPVTTVLRWVSSLHSQDLIERRGDPLDCRRVFISLSNTGQAAMHTYFQEVSNAPPLNPITL